MKDTRTEGLILQVPTALDFLLMMCLLIWAVSA